MSQQKQHKIYQLGLHGTVEEAGFRIIRVPGGWIYESLINEDGDCSSVFVPFHNEFQTKEF